MTLETGNITTLIGSQHSFVALKSIDPALILRIVSMESYINNQKKDEFFKYWNKQNIFNQTEIETLWERSKYDSLS